MNVLEPKRRLSIAGKEIAYEALNGLWAGIPEPESCGKGCVAPYPRGHFTLYRDPAYVPLKIPKIETNQYDSNYAYADENPSGRTPKKTQTSQRHQPHAEPEQRRARPNFHLGTSTESRIFPKVSATDAPSSSAEALSTTRWRIVG